MLELQGQGEMKLLKPGKSVRNETPVKTASMRFELVGVPLDVVQRGFVGQLSLFYSKDDDLKIGDLDYLPVSRHVSNVTASIAGVVLEHCIVNRVRIVPRAGRICDVFLDVKGEVISGLDVLHDALKTTVAISLVEHEFETTAEKEQREAA